MSSEAGAAKATVDAATHINTDPNALTTEEEEAMKALRIRIEESKKRGASVAAKYSDFELAQFVVVAKCKVEKAYKRFKNYHRLLTKHKFGELSQERILAGADQFAPCMSFSGYDKEGRAILCMRAAGLLPREIDFAAAIHNMVSIFKIANPDIATTRRGVIFVTDMKGFGWKNFSLQMEKEFSGLYQEGYPVRVGGFYILRAPWWMNALLKIMRTFLKKKLMDRIRTVYFETENPADPANLFNSCPRDQIHKILGGTADGDLRNMIVNYLDKQRKQPK